MRKLSLALCTVFTVFTMKSNAQQRSCASHDVYQKQLTQSPVFAKNQKEIETYTQAYIAGGGSRQFSMYMQRGVATYNIPVVVHVLYNTSAQNISDAQIQSQIDILNQDFQLNNADTNKIPSAFKSVLADCKIQFCLAKRDPNGNATTGIVRKSTTKTSFGSDDGVKYSSSGGDDAWSTSQYLNLWVCNLGGGLLGYAQFPGGAAATDGVVILYSAFGNTGTVSSPYNKGRTATHEVGHWLNLRHIWGDANCGSDLVGDTPTQQTANYGCPTYPHVTCSNGTNGDMFMNYMDYVDDQCMQMFTIGQRDRMYAVLKSGGARASLASSLGCTAPTQTCNTPTNVAAGSITQTGATISWAAATGAVSYSLQYKLSTASSYTTVTTSPTSYTLNGLTAGATYNFQVATSCSGTTSAYSTAQSFTTAAQTCNTPTSVTAGNITQTGATISWTAATGAVSYKIQYKLSTASSYTTVTTSSTSYALSGLTAGTTYNYQVATTCSANSSVYSTTQSFTTTAPVCNTPTGLAAGSITQTSATISWTAATGAVSYNLQYKLSTASSYTTVATNSTSYILSGLTAGTTYNYQVATTCSANSSTYSTPQSFATTAATCTDKYETNNTLATAAAIPVGTSFDAQIASSTDKDYYSFSNSTSAKNIKVSLTNLPADYDVILYNPSGTQVGISQNASTTSETINYNNGAVGTYKVYVYGYNSAYSSTKCYTLKVETTAALAEYVETANTTVLLYPQPASNIANIKFTKEWKGNTQVMITDMLGKIVSKLNLNIDSNIPATINTGRLSNGMYVIQMNNGQNTSTQKLLIQR